jgi:hypothetical protein
MPVPFLDAMAQAIYYFEGHRPSDRNHRNNNPGNLRQANEVMPEDSDGYVVFPHFVTGYEYLLGDIRAKVTGHNSHGLGRTSTLVEFFEVYAPSGDSNHPRHYATFVAWWLSVTYSTQFYADNTFDWILSKINQEVN